MLSLQTIKPLVQSFFKGFAQIMLQNNTYTGVLFLAAILYDSTLMALAGAVANIVAIGTAKILKLDKNDIQNGIYGFNATLYGIAIMFYFEQNIWIWISLIAGAIATTLLMAWAIKVKIPLFTFPFIAVTLIALYVLSIPSLGLDTVTQNFVDIKEMDDFLIEGHAFGQVIFQGSLIAGLVFFIGVYINKPISALYGFVGVILSIYISHLGQESSALINNGTYSFNAVLCGIALGGTRLRDGVYVVLAVVIATYIDILLIRFGWTTLTFPFVAAMWIMTIVLHYEKKIDLKLKPLINK